MTTIGGIKMTTKGKSAAIALAVAAVCATGAASAQVCNDTTIPLQCNGSVALTTTGSLVNGATLLQIVAKDLDSINGLAQNVAAKVCDIGSLNDQFSAEIFRTSSPKDINRCVTAVGGNCTVLPVEKAATAAQDKVFLIVHSVFEDVTGAIGGPFNINFQVTAPGWETLKVNVLDNTSGVSTSLPTGTGCP